MNRHRLPYLQWLAFAYKAHWDRSIEVLLKFLKPLLDRAEFKVRCLANKLRLGIDVQKRGEVPHMAGPVDQMLGMLFGPIPLRRKIGVVA
jgi:hypothetical protein